MSTTDTERTIIRHLLATLAYRAEKSVRDVPEEYPEYALGPESRTPLTIVSHMADLMGWAQAMASGVGGWNGSEPGTWEEEVDRFFTGLGELDRALAAGTEPQVPLERLLQGPIADALTHVGQLAMIRRLAGSHVRGENYVAAEIEIGRVGREQSNERQEFG